jgi:hypothetical protein
MLEEEWKESNCEPQVGRVVQVYKKRCYKLKKPSSRIISHYGQATAVAWRKYGIISKIEFTSALNVFFHVKYFKKIGH